MAKGILRKAADMLKDMKNQMKVEHANLMTTVQNCKEAKDEYMWPLTPFTLKPHGSFCSESWFCSKCQMFKRLCNV